MNFDDLKNLLVGATGGQTPGTADATRQFNQRNSSQDQLGQVVPPGGVIANLLTSLGAIHPDQPRYMGGQQVLGSYIPTASNIKEFENRRLQWKADNWYKIQHLPDEVQDQVSYMAARYPNRMAIPTSITADPSLTGSTIRGQFKAYNQYPNNPLTQTSHVTYDPFSGAIPTTLGHETQHAVDLQRKGVGFFATDKPRNTMTYDEYANLPDEKRAFQAGATAGNSYKKYEDILYNKQLTDWFQNNPEKK